MSDIIKYTPINYVYPRPYVLMYIVTTTQIHINFGMCDLTTSADLCVDIIPSCTRVISDPRPNKIPTSLREYLPYCTAPSVHVLINIRV